MTPSCPDTALPAPQNIKNNMDPTTLTGMPYLKFNRTWLGKTRDEQYSICQDIIRKSFVGHALLNLLEPSFPLSFGKPNTRSLQPKAVKKIAKQLFHDHGPAYSYPDMGLILITRQEWLSDPHQYPTFLLSGPNIEMIETIPALVLNGDGLQASRVGFLYVVNGRHRQVINCTMD